MHEQTTNIIKYIVIDIRIYTYNSIKNGCTDIKRLKQMV